MCQTGNKPSFDRIGTRSHDNGNSAGRFHCGTERWGTSRDDDVNLKTDQLSRQIGNSIGFRPAPTDFKDYVFSFDVAQVSQTLPECLNVRRLCGSGRGNEEPYPGDFLWLLRLRRNKLYAKSRAPSANTYDFATHWLAPVFAET